MSEPQPIPTSPLDPIRARLKRLATEPRVMLVPEGRSIVRELVAALDEIDSLRARVASIERGLARAMQQEEFE